MNPEGFLVTTIAGGCEAYNCHTVYQLFNLRRLGARNCLHNIGYAVAAHNACKVRINMRGNNDLNVFNVIRMRSILGWAEEFNNICDPIIIIAILRCRCKCCSYHILSAADARQSCRKRRGISCVLCITAVQKSIPSIYNQTYDSCQAGHGKRDNNQRLPA